MQGTYNIWLVATSYLVAVAASFAALELGGRVTSARGRAVWIWMTGGSVAMGLGIWSMHFIAMLAFHLPVTMAYDVWITLFSTVPAIVCSAIVLALVRHGGLHGWRLIVAATLLGIGIAAMHYTGMAAIRIAPGIAYQPLLFMVSVAVAIAVAYVALKLAFSLSGATSAATKGLAAMLMGAAIAAMHYTGMAAARFSPDAICTVAPGSIDNTWLAAIIAFSTGLFLIATIAMAAFDARFEDGNARMVVALQKANEEVAGYHAIEEEEKRIAKHLVDRITSAGHDPHRQVASWVLPARYFSGDLVAIARTPAQTLHVLLADGTGHGLAAALSALPVVQPFCAMTEKGFAIDTIAREINNKIRATLPVGRFVAAAIASIDPRFGVITVWNGGTPVCSLLDAQGDVLRRFTSAHMPLGILDDASFDARLESAHYPVDCQLFMASDGLIEVENDAGEAFGEERALHVVAEALPSVRLRALRGAVHGHLGSNVPSDDISILMVECRRLTSSATAPVLQGELASLTGGKGCDVRLVLSARELRRHDIVPALCNLLKELGISATSAPQVFVVLSELYNNALDHGLLEIEASLKKGPQGFDRYMAERAQRLKTLEHGTIEIAARYIECSGRPCLQMSIKHTGAGFEYQPYLTKPIATLADSQPHGRGIGLVRSICTRFEYRDAGREAEVVLPLM
jgi:NO-binding membrane sensor protein with MHYT domain/serine phosphatase RsbU (regulator of sigma subunit)